MKILKYKQFEDVENVDPYGEEIWDDKVYIYKVEMDDWDRFVDYCLENNFMWNGGGRPRKIDELYVSEKREMFYDYFNIIVLIQGGLMFSGAYTPRKDLMEHLKKNYPDVEIIDFK